MSRAADTSGRGWWLTFGRGLVALCLGGALLIAASGESRIATFIGVYWLLGAVLTIGWVTRSRGLPGTRLAGLAAAIAGVTALILLARRPLDDVVGTGLLLDLVGSGAIATGAMRMLGGFRDDQVADRRAHRRQEMLVGVLDIGLGTALIVASDSTSASVRFAAAAWGLVGGTFLLLDALRLRRFARTNRDSSRGLRVS